jgi:hypothetical protein
LLYLVELSRRAWHVACGKTTLVRAYAALSMHALDALGLATSGEFISRDLKMALLLTLVKPHQTVRAA